MFIGQVARGMRERGAFQEMDYRALFGSTAKWATEIDDPARIPEIVSRAFHVAMQGRPGPVVIAIPEDMLTETAGVADALRVDPVDIWPGPPQMGQLQASAGRREKPGRHCRRFGLEQRGLRCAGALRGRIRLASCRRHSAA